MMWRINRLASVGILAIVACGCAGNARPAPVAAGGKVFYKDVPAAGALVVFHPVDFEQEKRIGGKPFAIVREDGSFVLTTYQQDDGAPPGEYGVTVEWQGPKDKNQKSGKLVLSGEGGPGASSRSIINPKYGNPQQPAIKVTVREGQANQFEIRVD